MSRLNKVFNLTPIAKIAHLAPKKRKTTPKLGKN